MMMLPFLAGLTMSWLLFVLLQDPFHPASLIGWVVWACFAVLYLRYFLRKGRSR